MQHSRISSWIPKWQPLQWQLLKQKLQVARARQCAQRIIMDVTQSMQTTQMLHGYEPNSKRITSPNRNHHAPDLWNNLPAKQTERRKRTHVNNLNALAMQHQNFSWHYITNKYASCDGAKLTNQRRAPNGLKQSRPGAFFQMNVIFNHAYVKRTQSQPPNHSSLNLLGPTVSAEALLSTSPIERCIESYVKAMVSWNPWHADK